MALSNPRRRMSRPDGLQADVNQAWQLTLHAGLEERAFDAAPVPVLRLAAWLLNRGEAEATVVAALNHDVDHGAARFQVLQRTRLCIVTCPHCKAPVQFARLGKHIRMKCPEAPAEIMAARADPAPREHRHIAARPAGQKMKRGELRLKRKAGRKASEFANAREAELAWIAHERRLRRLDFPRPAAPRRSSGKSKLPPSGWVGIVQGGGVETNRRKH